MNDIAHVRGPISRSAKEDLAFLQKRRSREYRFRAMGISAIIFALSCLIVLFGSIIGKGYSAFLQTEIKLTVSLGEKTVIFADRLRPTSAELRKIDFNSYIRKSLVDQFPDVDSRRDKKKLYGLVSSGARHELKELIRANPQLIGTKIDLWVLAADDVDMYVKGYLDINSPEMYRRLNNKEVAWIDSLVENGGLQKKFNWRFFNNADSREPEMAGLRGALVGSAYTLLVTFLLSLPIGVMAAIYLEEFAPRNRVTEFIEVNINNLAAVPSIVFGLLGLGIFLNFFGMARSAPIVGGLVLSLMTLPTIIIVSRVALKAVPGSIREAAMGIGASKMQVVLHHVLPLGMPGILTGAILGMARALGETAPLLMIGMVAFIADIPKSVNDSATVLPVQVFLWADSPERAFVERTSAAIMVLLLFLLATNLIVILMRHKFERKW